MIYRCKEGHFTDKEHDGKDCPYDSRDNFENLKNRLHKDEKEMTSDEIEKICGKEYKGVKGQEAISKLLKEKQGHVKGAFYREDIGEIDLLWGNDNLGLQHIIKRREEQGINTKEFLSTISECIEKGNFRKKNNRGNFEFMHEGKIAVIAPELLGNKIVFLLTAFKTHSKK